MNKKKDNFNFQILTFTHKLKKNLLFLHKPWLITHLVVNLIRIYKDKYREYRTWFKQKSQKGLWH